MAAVCVRGVIVFEEQTCCQTTSARSCTLKQIENYLFFMQQLREKLLHWQRSSAHTILIICDVIVN
jgi:hypothetical protein